mmetsp:Transcript_22651/g.64129  ORF Transcript_22651/g.64129 Transcript_22651/m.64129 type:complete len:81 (-) Transcript_22651:54-296(-)
MQNGSCRDDPVSYYLSSSICVCVSTEKNEGKNKQTNKQTNEIHPSSDKACVVLLERIQTGTRDRRTVERPIRRRCHLANP